MSSLNSSSAFSADDSLKSFLIAYASLPLKKHLVIGAVFLLVLALIKLLISISQPQGIWWHALNTTNLFIVISALMYGAIFFSQVSACLTASVMRIFLQSERAVIIGCIVGVLAAAVMIMLLAPYVLHLIWRL